MRRKLPPLNALRAFEASGRSMSFTAAAKELLVTQGAVSRHVAGLEEWLGVQLVVRTQRGIELTERGAAYLRVLTGALDQIDYATRQLRDDPQDSMLRLKLPPTFAIRWLVPRLARFHSLHPHLEVQITSSHQTANFEREDVDVVIHSEQLDSVTPGYRPLLDEVLVPVCSPALLERGPPLGTPRDLAAHALLSSLHRASDWTTWLAAAGAADLELAGGIQFDNAALAYQAAVDELGIVIAQQALVADDLRSGRLVAPFALRVPLASAYCVAHHPDRGNTQRVAAFESWLFDEAARDALDLQAADRQASDARGLH
jgi:LysR family glycine cleavage system transcriptional activator